ncbi:hypothetical protein EJ08DRAFT_683173 [Tothia fuscella]|uniref:Uncharacterized protein n=1 Tax=Tothia fuscella TaxID=1048955 RepID=A0A9P4TSS0_9PEZI|nr:hypothetical protein EJ08DRAFT_683173 [Tothia fuscella]
MARLLEIPPELRLQIYSYIFSRKRVIVDIVLHRIKYPIYNNNVRNPKTYHSNNAEVLRTCRTFWIEALPLLYSLAVPYIDVHDLRSGEFERFYQTIGPRASANINVLQLRAQDLCIKALAGVDYTPLRRLTSLQTVELWHDFEVRPYNYPYTPLPYTQPFSHDNPFFRTKKRCSSTRSAYLQVESAWNTLLMLDPQRQAGAKDSSRHCYSTWSFFTVNISLVKLVLFRMTDFYWTTSVASVYYKVIASDDAKPSSDFDLQFESSQIDHPLP